MRPDIDSTAIDHELQRRFGPRRHGSDPRPGVEAIEREIRNETHRARHEQAAGESATARAAQHAAEDRDARRARFRAVFAAAPERREHVGELWDVVDVDRERARTNDPPAPAGESR